MLHFDSTTTNDTSSHQLSGKKVEQTFLHKARRETATRHCPWCLVLDLSYQLKKVGSMSQYTVMPFGLCGAPFCKYCNCKATTRTGHT